MSPGVASEPAAADPPGDGLPPGLVEAVRRRVENGRRVRRLLPAGGRLHVDRRLPFLCLLRRDPATHGHLDALVVPHPAYLLAGRASPPPARLLDLISAVAEPAGSRLGAFLVVELWERPAADPAAPAGRRPAFTVATDADRADRVDGGDGGEELAPTVDTLERALAAVRVGDAPAATVRRAGPEDFGGMGHRPLAARTGGSGRRWHWLGIGVEPVYRSGGVLYPMLLLELEGELARALRRTLFDFARRLTSLSPEHPDELGRRALVRTAWHVDRRLAEVARSFEFLRLATPVDLDATWERFRSGGCRRPPELAYRPLPIDPEALKRTLFNLAIERVEDPTLAWLFREKQEELDRQITMLRDRGTPAFLYGSFQLFGEVEDELYDLAERLLARLPVRSDDDAHGGSVPAAAMAERARREIAAYRERTESFPAAVELCDDIAAGMMVSQDRLLISRDACFPASRVEALIHHEVGTHLLTYCNGRAQRLRLLWSGMPGYNTLQEGLAVLAEYLVGGLSRRRLRTLAARVVATRGLCEGASFVDTYRELVEDYGYSAASAFTITVRIHRGGGLTKDAEYLRGLVAVLRYLGAGGELEPLFVGKVAPAHLPALAELRRRGVLEPIPLLPSYLETDGARERLARVRQGIGVLDLVVPPSEAA